MLWLCLLCGFFTLSLARVGELPSVQPQPARIVAYTPNSLSVFRMMSKILTELGERGHTLEYLGHPKLQRSAEALGYNFTPLPDFYPDDSKVLPFLQQDFVEFQFTKAGPFFGHWEMGRLIATLAKHFESSYKESVLWVDDYFKKTGKPDLMIVDFFSAPIIDWATNNNVKFVILYGSPLGFFAGYGDCPACPSTIYAQSNEEFKWFPYRVMKAIGVASIIFHTVENTENLNRMRLELGMEPYDHPLTNWIGRPAIIPLSYTVETPRLLSPLLQVVGLLQEPIDTTVPKDKWATEDVALWDRLDKLPRPIIYISFGSEPWFLDLERLATLTKGIDAALKLVGSGSIVIAMRKEIQDVHGGEESVKNLLPSSAHLFGWVNQGLLLAHPSVNVFVSHGGLQSISESILNLVPLLVIPQYGDQPANAMRLEENGLGLWNYDEEITVENTKVQILHLLNNNSIQENLVKHFKINRYGYPSHKKAADVIELELLVGSQHLIPIEDKVPFWVAQGIDVLAFFLFVLLTVLWVIYFVVRSILSLYYRLICCRSKPTTKPQAKPKRE